VEQSLVDLKTSGRAQVVDRYGIHFWSASPSHYPIESQSQATSPEGLRVRRSKEKTWVRYHFRKSGGEIMEFEFYQL